LATIKKHFLLFLIFANFLFLVLHIVSLCHLRLLDGLSDYRNDAHTGFCASASDRCGGEIIFLGPSVSACVLPCVRPVSTISQNPANGILPNFVAVIEEKDELIRF